MAIDVVKMNHVYRIVAQKQSQLVGCPGIVNHPEKRTERLCGDKIFEIRPGASVTPEMQNLMPPGDKQLIQQLDASAHPAGGSPVRRNELIDMEDSHFFRPTGHR
jgi:hypothetical protein